MHPGGYAIREREFRERGKSVAPNSAALPLYTPGYAGTREDGSVGWEGGEENLGKGTEYSTAPLFCTWLIEKRAFR